MNNRLDDFFDNEYNKSVQDQQGQESNSYATVNDTLSYGYGGNPHNPNNANKTQNKGITALLVSIALILAILFGYCMSFVVGADQQSDILGEVLQTLRTKYYFDVSDEEWEQIVANGGTALLQGVDRYGQLLSPQDAYNLIEGVGVSMPDGNSLGFASQPIFDNGVMVITEIMPESNSLGRLEPMDFIISVQEVKDRQGNYIEDINGDVVGFVSLMDVTLQYATHLFDKCHQITLNVIRDGTLVHVPITKGRVGSMNNVLNELEFVQYYFGDDATNVSIVTGEGRATNTKDYKRLDLLPPNVGYISISQFSASTESDCATEFAVAMEYYKTSGRDYLVVDVKGNPGGSVDLVSTIAGYLATDQLVDHPDVSKAPDGQILTTTMRTRDDKAITPTYAPTLYSEYFAMPTTTKQIAIWTDDMSASASELLTGVVTDYGTAVHMGTTTYGKGIAQSIEPLLTHTDTVVQVDGTEGEFYWCLYYTFAKYYSPLGVNIHGVGYTPADPYNGLVTYQQLMNAVDSYWN